MKCTVQCRKLFSPLLAPALCWGHIYAKSGIHVHALCIKQYHICSCHYGYMLGVAYIIKNNCFIEAVHEMVYKNTLPLNSDFLLRCK